METNSDDMHILVLKKAFKSMSSHPDKVIISARNNKEVVFNRDILMLFSSFVRSLLTSIPCCSSSAGPPVILLPEVRASVLVKIQDVLSAGFCDELTDVVESGELLEAMAALGLDIRQLHLGREQRPGEKRREVMVNLDTVRTNTREIVSVIEARRKEGSQVVLVKTAKSPANSSQPSAAATTNAGTKSKSSSTSSSNTPQPPPSSSVAAPAASTSTTTTSANRSSAAAPPPGPAPAAQPASAASMVSPLSIAVKKERHEETGSSAVPPPEPMEQDTETETTTTTTAAGATAATEKETPAAAAASSSSTPAAAVPEAPVSVAPVSKVESVETETYQCEVSKCNKPFSTVILLKYHYCSHFMSLLKKNYDHLLDATNTCRDCKKNFQNSRRLLLHIGVNHDKINHILKARGYKELPPHTSGSHAVPSSGGGEQQLPRPGPGPSSGSGDKFDIRKMMDVKSSVPLLAPAPPPATPPPPQLDSDKTAAAAGDKAAGVSKAAAAGPVPAPPLTRSSALSASASKPPTAPSSSEVPGPKSSPGAAANVPGAEKECNYELDCQVCKQQMNSLNQLEQHCCRHFMKELAEQFAGLMDDLKCGLCNTIFKQKHKLLLHIGCKHGKINEILKQKGFAVLPAPVLNTTNHAMQKQLIQIKKEKQDLDKAEPEDVMDFAPRPNQTSAAAAAEPETRSGGGGDMAASLNPGPFSTELSEILKKYSNLTQSPSV